MTNQNQIKFSSEQYRDILQYIKKSDEIKIVRSHPGTKYKYKYDYKIYNSKTNQLLLSVEKDREKRMGYDIKNCDGEIIFTKDRKASNIARSTIYAYHKQENDITYKLSFLMRAFMSSSNFIKSK